MDIASLHRPLLYRVDGMDTVVRRDNLVYLRAEGADWHMDVYGPPDPAPGQRLPGVLFVHGGPIGTDPPLPPKDWGVYRGYGALAAACGFVGVTFNHRYFSLGHLETAASDIGAALRFVRERASEFGLDPERLGIWAFSGGGPLLSPTLAACPPSIRCLIAYYASLDLRPVPPRYTAGVPREVLHRFSPAAHLQARGAARPPMFIARAGLDNPGLNGSIDGFVQEALAANLDLTVVNHAQGHHGFDTVDDDARTRQIIGWTVDFLRSTLLGA